MDNNPVVEVRLGDWITEGWNMFTSQWKGWVTISVTFFVVTVLPLLCLIGVMYGMTFLTMMSQAQHPRGASPEVPVAAVLTMYLGIFGFVIVMMPLTVFLMGGAYRAAFKQLRGGQVEFRDLFCARDCYWRLLGGVLLQGLLIMIGAMLCIIPAFIVAGALFFTIPLIIDRNMGIIEAMSASRDLTQPRLLMFTLFAFLVQLISSAGSYLCYIGLIATWPLMFTIAVVAYRDCFGAEGALKFAQPSSAGQAGYGPGPVVDTPPAAARERLCPNCQASLPPTAQFCFHCGTNLNE